jgi:CRISPR/Cas system-associated endonuclease Cas1
MDEMREKAVHFIHQPATILFVVMAIFLYAYIDNRNEQRRNIDRGQAIAEQAQKIIIQSDRDLERKIRRLNRARNAEHKAIMLQIRCTRAAVEGLPDAGACLDANAPPPP